MLCPMLFLGQGFHETHGETEILWHRRELCPEEDMQTVEGMGTAFLTWAKKMEFKEDEVSGEDP